MVGQVGHTIFTDGRTGREGACYIAPTTPKIIPSTLQHIDSKIYIEPMSVAGLSGILYDKFNDNLLWG
jgi:hypothetical protein